MSSPTVQSAARDRQRAARLLLILLAFSGAACDAERAPDVLLITVDTLRADHIGPYDPAVTSTPHLDALAAEGTLYERAYAPMPLTRPSHFSMLTSLYPREHGVLNNAMALPPTTYSLVETFAGAGYRTAAFVGVNLFGPDSGAQRGFEQFDFPEGPQRRAESFFPRAMSWIAGLGRDESFFVWVHAFDPHLPYAPPSGFRQGVPEGEDLDWERIERIAAEHGGDLPAETLEQARTLYRGEVAYIDDWIGKLLAQVDASRDLDNTIVVFTADHGECFENGIYFEHADCLYESGVRIPLIVRYPPDFAAGARIGGQAGILDVAPTVLAAAGFELPEGISGEPLQAADLADRYVLLQYPFFQQRAAENRPRRREAVKSVAGDPVRQILFEQERVGVVGPEWKLLQGGGAPELFQLTADSGERENLATKRKEDLERLSARLEDQLQRHPLNLIDPGEINAELLETLKALGYVQ